MLSSPKHPAEKDPRIIGHYSIGDFLGKGAFGSVYRALNLKTGETVAVKQLKISFITKSDLQSITSEVHLLKKLDHPNIVKYHGFMKTRDSLYIILEYCENGSLSKICKKFGKMPENLVVLYIAQVLEGLAYLHEQGVIHRDIKGANILTIKEGLIKLADFGVATRLNGASNVGIVAGSPNWMAPEIIELSGASTSSIYGMRGSVGCTVVELLTGKPPYYNLEQMATLFAIVNDDHPPIPEGISQAAESFLMKCFQKDPYLRVSAKKLLKHPWITKLQRKSKNFPKTNYDEAVSTIKKWNATFSKSKIKVNKDEFNYSTSSNQANLKSIKFKNKITPFKESKVGLTDDSRHIDQRPGVEITQKKFLNDLQDFINFKNYEELNDNEWDKDFTGDIGIMKNSSDEINKAETTSNGSKGIFHVKEKGDSSIEDYSDLYDEDDLNFEKKVFHMNNRHRNNVQYNRRVSKKSGNLYDDTRNLDFRKTSGGDLNLSQVIQRKFSQAKSAELSEESEEDPFSDFDDNLSESDGDLTSTNDIEVYEEEVRNYVEIVNSSDSKEEIHESLLNLKELASNPSIRKFIIKFHGPVILIQRLNETEDEIIILNILVLLYNLICDNIEYLKLFATLSGLITIRKFLCRPYDINIRLISADIIQQYCIYLSETQCTLLSCGGLFMILELLAGHKDSIILVAKGVSCFWYLFSTKCSVTKNDLCRLLSRYPILSLLFSSLYTLIPYEENFSDSIGHLFQILLYFSQADLSVKQSIINRQVFKELFRLLRRVHEKYKVLLLKFLKNMSSSPKLHSTILKSNAVYNLVLIISEQNKKSSYYKEILIHSIHSLFNLCHYNLSVLQDAVSDGLIPILVSNIMSDRFLKEFTVPMLCELSSSNTACHQIMWKYDVLSIYISLLKDPNWQVLALDSILEWLNLEFVQVEKHILVNDNINIIIESFAHASSTSLEKLLEPFRKLLLSSKRLCLLIVQHSFIDSLISKLKSRRAIIRLNLLRLLQVILNNVGREKLFASNPILHETLKIISEEDHAILVRELSKEILLKK